MAATGISVISHQTLPTETVTSAYSNPAFNGDLNTGDDVTNNNNNTATSPGDEQTTTTTEKTQAKYDEFTPPASKQSVDFMVPEKQSRDRTKSVSADGPYRGMGKEELLRYSSQPLWRNLRYVCMSVVLTGWLALLITVVALVLTYPQCRDAQSREWWQKSVIYRVYVRSFLDADGDGVGDLQGIIAKLDYIQSTGANTISLSPFYKLSPGAESDTHIVDHKDVDHVFGNLTHFRMLVNETHARGMYITVDFIPNHTSDQHQWFIESSKDSDERNNRYRSYYVWTQGSQPINNWQSVYGCSAWENVTSHDWYLHQGMTSQPDLNLRSDKVKVELQDILKFWLDQGVDGFYIRDVDFLFEDYDMRDEPVTDNSTLKQNCFDVMGQVSYPYSAYNHSYTRGEAQNLDIVAYWRAFLDQYGNTTGSYKILLADATGSMDHVRSYYGLYSRDGVDFPLNPLLTHYVTNVTGGRGLGGLVEGWVDVMEAGRWPNWMSGDDRTPRLADRLGDKLAASYLMMMMLLPGTPFLYYGDEIGLRDVPLPVDTPDYLRNKPMRSPMLWVSQQHSNSFGFCEKGCGREGPWLNQSVATVHITDAQGNMQEQGSDAESQMNRPESVWNLLKNVTSLRADNPSFVYGDYNVALVDQHVFSFVRDFDGQKGFLVAVNLANDVISRNFQGSYSTVPGGGSVELVAGQESGLSIGDDVSLASLSLAPHEAVVVSWDYEAKEL